MAWFQEEKKLKRILAEKKLLARYYPNFVWDVTDDDHVVVYGTIGPTNVIEDSYTIGVILPDSYGNGYPPKVYVLNKDLPSGTPHIYADQSLCLFHNEGEYTRKTSLVTVLNWVSLWLALYENYLKTGERW